MKPSSVQLPSALTLTLLITLPLLLLALALIKAYPNEFNLQNSFSKFRISGDRQPEAFSEGNTMTVSVRPDFRLLIGILTLPDNYERRHMLRLVYSLQKAPSDVVIDVRFVFCNLSTEEQKVLVAMEIMKFNDIIVLRCPENMNDGKTYTYFSSLPTLFNETPIGGGSPYDFVMKAVDDIFFRLPWLAESLRIMPREDLYYGFVSPCQEMNPFHGYMAGMGYVLSWDLVQWIATSDIPRNNAKGIEDLLLGNWLHDGHRGKNRHNTKFAMYDVPVPFPGACIHDFVPETIGVHKLKDHARWVLTLKYFNFTAGVKPSKFYHFD